MSKPDFHALAQPGIKGLKAYDPGLDLVSLRRQSQAAGKFLVELGSNENSLGPSPRAREALLDCLHELHRYPDPLGGDLKLAIASCHGLDTAQVMLGNGSHELLMMIAQVFEEAGLPPGLLQVLPQLSARHQVIIAAVSDPRVEEMSAGRSDAATVYGAAAAERARNDRRHLASRLRNLGIEVVDAGPAELAPALADKYLAMKASGRL